ncbi:uncharacterized protein LOC143620234 [Bidens hawaiensis]|uniref:uncharacterized protein LOC143620234 n=1 Tax=Bidens hawaiensis TaxID=980011 RepID=UPI00404BA0E4
MTTPGVSLFVLALLALTCTSSARPTIYEFVSRFGFPPGIFPDYVTSYTTAPQVNGYTFEIKLREPCYIMYDLYVHLDSKITGYITYGKITIYKGLIGKPDNYIWFQVDEMKLNDDSITYTLAFIKVDLDIEQFEWIPTCGFPIGANHTRSSNLIEF